jgi:hypothetical protein
MPKMSDVANIAYWVIDGVPPPVVLGTADIGVPNDIVSGIGPLFVVGIELVVRIGVVKIEKVGVFVSTCVLLRQFAIWIDCKYELTALTDDPTVPSGESNGRVSAVVSEEVAIAPVALGEREVELDDDPDAPVILAEIKIEISPLRRGTRERVLWLPDSNVRVEEPD